VKGHDDRHLREAFRELRDAEAESTPSFERSLAVARSRASGKRIGLWRPLLVAASALALLLWATPRTPRERVEWSPAIGSVGAWATPTDVLLETPGRGLLRDLPSWNVRRNGESTEGRREPTSRLHGRIYV
jgi:hypothetical protein